MPRIAVKEKPYILKRLQSKRKTFCIRTADLVACYSRELNAKEREKCSQVTLIVGIISLRPAVEADIEIRF